MFNTNSGYLFVQSFNVFILLQLVYMRKFEKLRTLNASGNPICEHQDYKLFAIAYLPHLVYLDFRLVDADFVSLIFFKSYMILILD